MKWRYNIRNRDACEYARDVLRAAADVFARLKKSGRIYIKGRRSGPVCRVPFRAGNFMLLESFGNVFLVENVRN